MSGIYFLIPLLLTVLVSYLIVRGGAIALRLTGLDEKRARFQALSAFSGTGFTTRESERVVNHPTRRRIVTWLMIMGNAGIVAVIVTGSSSLVSSKGFHIPLNILIFAAGIFVFYKLATKTRLAKRWETFIEKKLIKMPAFEEEEAEDLLRLIHGYGLVRYPIRENSLLLGLTLSKAKLTGKGILVLGIEREEKWIPTPKAGEKMLAGDKIVVYGPNEILQDVFRES